MHVFGAISQFAKDHPIKVASNLSFCLLVPLQDVALPHFYGKLIQAITTNQQVVSLMVAVVALFTIVEMGFVASDYHDIGTFSQFQTYIRIEIVKNVLKRFESQFQELNVENVMSKIVRIPNVLQVFYERLKYSIIPYILAFGISTFYFYYHDPLLGAALLLLSVAYMAMILQIPYNVCKPSSVRCDQAVNETHEEIDDILRNFLAMQGDREKQVKEIDRLYQREELFAVKFAQTMKCLMNTKALTSSLLLVFIGVFVWRCHHLLKKKVLPTSKFITLFFIIVYLSNAMMSMEGQLRDMVFEWGALMEADDLFHKLERPPRVTPSPHMRLLVPAEGIGLRHVWLSFQGATEPILRDVSLHVGPGERVVVVGDIGSGKSTILKMLARFYEPDQGFVYVDGTAYTNTTVTAIKQKVGYVPQHPQLFNRTVMENILYGNEEKHTREQVMVTLERLNLLKEFDNLNEGVDTLVGKNGHRLSGGQRQIVWCMRTMLSQPKYILLDEPTSSLDEKAKATFIAMLQAMMHATPELTIIIVTHDPVMKAFGKRTVVVNQGKVVEDFQSE